MVMPRSELPGHQAEAILVEFFRSLPGVESADVSSKPEDDDKVDIVLTFKGDYVPLEIQVTGNPHKTPSRDLRKEVIFLKFDLHEVLDHGVSRRLGLQFLQKIVKWVSRYDPERLNGLLAYWGI